MRKKGGKDMNAILHDRKDAKKTPDGINFSFLKSAKRLPSKDGKVILDRNNPDHVAWAEGYENK
ncbi:hypothetical protein D3C86_1745980 [compost metagenome]